MTKQHLTLSFLLCLLLAASFLSLLPFVSATTGTMGNTVNTGSQTISVSINNPRGMKVLSPENAISVYDLRFFAKVSSGTKDAKCFITDTAGNILTNGVSNSVTIDTTAREYACDFATAPTITENTYYIIWVIFSGTALLYETDETTGISYSDTTNSYSSPTSPTDAVGTTGTRNFRYFYATVTLEDEPTPTPTPTPTPSPTPEPLDEDETIYPNVNYGFIPDAWGGYNVYGSILFTDEYPPDDHQITSYSTTIERTLNAGSVKIESIHGETENTARECDTGGIPITPNYHVTFGCWIKAAANSNARIGIDLYGAGGRICGKQSSGELFPPTENDDLVQDNWVIDNGLWNYREIKFTVPTTAIREGTSTAVEPTFLVAWMQGELDGAEPIYFADAFITVTGSFDIQETTVGTASGNLNIFYVLFGVVCFGVVLWQLWKGYN